MSTWKPTEPGLASGQDDLEPEKSFLLAVASARGGGRPLPGPDLRTNRLLRLAGWHGMTPLVAEALGDSAPEPIRRAFRRRTLLSFLYTDELARLLRLLHSAGIRAVPYKGAALAREVYGSFGLARLLSLVLDGTPSSGLLGAAAIELIVASIGLVILWRGGATSAGSIGKLATAPAAQ